MTDERFKAAAHGAGIGIAGNLALAVMKGTVGYVSGSKALIADALHSASNAAGSVAVLTGLRTAKPSSNEHHYGHGKAESITAIIVSVLMLLFGLEIAVTSVKAIYSGVPSPPKAGAIIAIIISVIVKEAMFLYKSRLKLRLSGQAGIDESRENRSDVYSSLAAFTGVGGAWLGNYLGNNLLLYLDPAAGLFIAALIIRKGYLLIAGFIHNTTEHTLLNEESAELIRTVQTVKGVIAVDGLKAREHGHYVVVDVKISVNPRISVLEGHDVAKNVKHLLMKRFLHVSEVSIHVNPYDPGYPYKNNVDPGQDDYPSLLH